MKRQQLRAREELRVHEARDRRDRGSCSGGAPVSQPLIEDENGALEHLLFLSMLGTLVLDVVGVL